MVCPTNIHLFGARLSPTSIRGWDGTLGFGVSLLPKTFHLIPGYVFNDGASKREIACERHGSTKSYLHTLGSKAH